MKRSRMLQILCGMLIALILFGYFFIKPKLQAYAQLRITEKNLKIKLKAATVATPNHAKTPSQPIPFITATFVESEILDFLIQTIQLNGFTMYALQPLKNQTMPGIKRLPIKINMTGPLAQFTKFLTDLAEYSLPIEINDFSINVDKMSHVSIEMQISVVNLRITPEKLNLTKHRLDANKLQEAPLNQLKFIGYLRQKHIFWGLLRVPNGETREVYVGSIIGKESGRVLSVDEREMIVGVGEKIIYLHYVN